MMIVGIIMMSASVYFFQTPNNFTLGGIAGIAIVLNKIILNASPEVAAILTQGVIMASVLSKRYFVRCSIRVLSGFSNT